MIFYSVGRPRKNEAGWREGWWNPVRGNTVRPEVLTPGMAVVAASALSPSYSEGVPDLELSACTKPGNVSQNFLAVTVRIFSYKIM